MADDISVSLENGATTTATHYAPADPVGALLVLAHGAGAGQRHPFMVSVAAALAGRGIDVVTFNFPYMEHKRRLPDRAPVLEACFRAVVAAAIDRGSLRARTLFIGGKSMGGRMATHLAAQGLERLDGVIALGYPLHPPGKPEQVRTAHLSAITAPVLIVQGERDAFGTPAELAPAIAAMRAPVTLHVVHGGDHSLSVKGRSKEQALESVATVVGAGSQLAWSDARYSRIRRALVPTSLRPTRDTERTSTRVPPPAGVRRITTSSLKPNQNVVSVASMRPAAGSTCTISHPASRAAASARSNAVLAGIGSVTGRDVRIGLSLLFADVRVVVECVGRVRREAGPPPGMSAGPRCRW